MKNDPALVVSGSCRVQHHPLRAAQGEHRLADVGRDGAATTGDAEHAGQLGVADRRGAVRPVQREGTASTTPAPGLRLLNTLER